MNQDEAYEQPTVTCKGCDTSLIPDDAPMFDSDGGVLCLWCAEDAVRKLIPQFDQWACEHVKLTKDPHRFVEQARWAPTPDEYAAGMRAAYTANSVAAVNRHRCTNYDELIANLDRDDLRDRALYIAIRHRAEELIEDRLEAMADEELEAFLDELDAEEAELSEDLASRAD